MQPDEITTLHQHWPDASAPHGLADRIIAHAVAHKQHRPLSRRLRAVLSLPPHSFAMKGFAVAACVMVAVLALDHSPSQKPKKYSTPMEQMVEEMIWNDYSY